MADKPNITDGWLTDTARKEWGGSQPFYERIPREHRECDKDNAEFLVVMDDGNYDGLTYGPETRPPFDPESKQRYDAAK